MKLHKLTPSSASSRLLVAVFGLTALCIAFLFPEHKFSVCKRYEDFTGVGDALPIRLDWSTPRFCKSLIDSPQPFDRNCTKARITIPNRPPRPPCDPNRPQFFSQCGEDYYLYTRHFRFLSRPGVYFDIAANDPVIISNTYFLDRCLAWRGVCVEANQKYHEMLHRKRSCHLVPTCVSETDGVQVQFALHGPSGGILATHKMANHTAVQQAAVEKKRCTDMKSIARRFGVTYVDYLNVDVEGHEMQVLKGWDWENVRVGVATIELNAWNRKAVKEFMKERGFKEHWSADGGFYMADPIWVHESVEFGNPE